MGLVGAAALGHGVRLDGGLRQFAGGADGAVAPATAGSASQRANLDAGASGTNLHPANADVPASALLPSMVASADDFFPTVALTALLAILRDDTLSLHHGPVLQAVTAVLKGLGGVRCLPFLSRVIPTFLHVVRASANSTAIRSSGSSVQTPSSGGSSVPLGAPGGAASSSSVPVRGGGQGFAAPSASGANTSSTIDDNSTSSSSGDAIGSSSGRLGFESGLREAVLAQLASLITLAKHHIRPWLPGIFSLMQELWPSQLPALLRVIEATAAALGEECRPHVITLVPHMLSALAHDGTRAIGTGSFGLNFSSSALQTSNNTVAASLLGVGSTALDHQHGGDAMWDGTRKVPFQPQSSATINPARINTRHVLHTIAVLVCAGRRALWSGSRHLLDDHLSLFVPALARLVDAGVGWTPTTSYTTGSMSAAASILTPVGALGVGSALAGGEQGREDSLTGSGGAGHSSSGLWISMNGVPSNSSSLGPYGPVHFATRKQAIDTLSALAASGVSIATYASRIIPALARTLADPSSSGGSIELKRAAVDCLCLMLLQMREEYVIWVPVVRRAAQMATSAAAVQAAQGNASDGSGPGTVSGATSLSNHAALLAADAGGIAGGPGGGSIAPNAFAFGGVSGTGTSSAVRHEAYERLVLLLLGLGTGYGYLGDDALALYGYGSPLQLPGNPADLATLLYDPGGANADGSGVRLAAALAIGPDGGPFSSGTATAAGADPAQIVHPAFSGLLGPVGSDVDTFVLPNSAAAPNASDSVIRLEVRPEVLKRAWETTAKSTKDDWTEWMRRLAVELLRESPSPALRSCSALAQVGFSPNVLSFLPSLPSSSVG